MEQAKKQMAEARKPLPPGNAALMDTYGDKLQAIVQAQSPPPSRR